MRGIELGELVFLSESDRLVRPETVPGDGFPQPRTPVNAGVVWSGLDQSGRTGRDSGRPGRPAGCAACAWRCRPARGLPAQGNQRQRRLRQLGHGHERGGRRAGHLRAARPAENSPATIQTFLARVPEEDRPGVVAAMRQMMHSCGAYQVDYRVIGLDGSVRTMEARGRVLPGPCGRPG